MTFRFARCVLAMVAALVCAGSAHGQSTGIDPTDAMAMPARVGPETGFDLPRFVSMDASEGRARRGPSRSHRIDWVFVRRGIPLIIIAEHGHWRRVIDVEGEGGWMHYSLLSGVRTGIIETDMVELRARPDTTAPIRAHVELGVIGRLHECGGEWCLFQADGMRGWVPQDAIWGTRPDEVFD